MRSRVKVAYPVLLLVSIGLTLSAAPTTAAETKTEPALSKFATDWASAFNAKDCAKVASLYMDDAVFMPPNEPAARGRAAIEAWCKTALGAFSDMAITPVESAISGAQGFDTGSYSASVKSATGPATTDRGKYLTVFKQVGGQWRIAYDIFNSDLPAGTPPKP